MNAVADAREVEELREVIRRIAEGTWIIGTAYNGGDFGWQVNVLDTSRPSASGINRYTAVRSTFAPTPYQAGLLCLALDSTVLEAK